MKKPYITPATNQHYIMTATLMAASPNPEPLSINPDGGDTQTMDARTDNAAADLWEDEE